MPAIAHIGRSPAARLIASGTCFAWAGLVLVDPPAMARLCGSGLGLDSWQLALAASRPFAWLGHWLLMCLAMMAVLAWPLARQLEASSFARSRPTISSAFIASYLASWFVTGFAFLAVEISALLILPGERLAHWLAILVALLAQLHPGRAGLVAAAHRIETVHAFGWAAVLSAGRYGMRAGGRCVAACWHFMLAAMAVHDIPFAWVPLTAAAIAERRAHRYGRWPGLIALGCVAVAHGMIG